MEFFTENSLVTGNLYDSLYVNNSTMVIITHINHSYRKRNDKRLYEVYDLIQDALVRVQNEFMFLTTCKFGTQTFPIRYQCGRPL